MSNFLISDHGYPCTNTQHIPSKQANNIELTQHLNEQNSMFNIN